MIRLGFADPVANKKRVKDLGDMLPLFRHLKAHCN